MSRKAYRICLVMLIVAGMVGGLLFYQFGEKKEPDMHKGVLVKQTENVYPKNGVNGEERQYEG